MKLLQLLKKTVAVSLGAAMLLAFPASALEETVSKTEYSPLSGVQVRLTQKIIDGEFFNYQVVECDLSNPSLSLDLFYPKEGASTLKGTKGIGTDNGAAVVMNADYFNRSSESNKGSAVGYNAKDGQMLSNALEEKVYSFSYNDKHQYSFDIFSNQIKIGFNDSVFEFVKTYNKYSSLEGVALFDKHWGKESLGSQGTLVELVIEDDILKEIRRDMPPVEIPENGYVLAGLSDLTTLFEQVQVGDQVTLEVITTPNLEFLPDFTVGGGSLLVEKGQLVTKMSYPIGSTTAFPALGISEDGKTVWFITVVNQKGITQKKMGELCLQEGAYYAINLDGGGSTQCAVKDNVTGELAYIHELSGNYERQIANAIGVIADHKNPKPYGIRLEDGIAYRNIPKKITATVYDENGDPLKIDESKLKFSIKSGSGSLKDGFYYGENLATETISVTYESVSAECNLTVVAPATHAVKNKDGSYKVTNADGYTREIPSEEFMLSENIPVTEKLPVTDSMAETVTLPNTVSVYGGSQSYNTFFYRSLTTAVLTNLKDSIYPFSGKPVENPMLEVVTLDNSENGILKNDMKEWNRFSKVLNTEKTNIILVMKEPLHFSKKQEEALFYKKLSEAHENGKNIMVLYRDQETKLQRLQDGVRVISVEYDTAEINTFMTKPTKYLKIHYNEQQMAYEIASRPLFR